jgi:hypothetical protein
LKFGQVVVVVQDTPVATAALSQLEEQVEIMQLKLYQCAQVGPIQCVLAAHGLVTGHIPVTQVWAVYLTSTDVISAISVPLEVAVALCVTAMPLVVATLDISAKAVLTVISAVSLDQTLA